MRGFLVTIAVARVLGLAPFRGSRPGEVREDRTLTILSAAGIILIGGTVNCYQNWIWSDTRSVEGTARHLSACITWLQFTLMLACIVNKSPLIVSVLNSEHMLLVAPLVSILPSMLVLLSYFTGQFLKIQTEYVADLWGWIWFVTQLLWVMIRTSEVAFFAFFLSCLTARFEELNDTLDALLEKRKTACLFWNVRETRPIHYIRKKHNEVTELTEVVVDYFGPHVLMDLVTETWWAVGTLFKMVSEPFYLVTLLDGLKSVVSRACMVVVAHRLSKAGNEILSTIHSFRNLSSLSDNEKLELEDFAEETFQRRVRVSLVGVADLDSFFLFRVAVAVVTSVVILVQFQQTKVTDL